jgi:hypothetical protein
MYESLCRMFSIAVVNAELLKRSRSALVNGLRRQYVCILD